MRRHGLGPQARLVYDELAEALRAGDFTPGQRLPSHRELATRWNVAPLTLRQALIRLEDEGLLRLEQGRGTFVCSPPPSGPMPDAIDPEDWLTDDVQGHGVQLASIVRVQQEIASADLSLHGVMEMAVDRAQSLTHATGAVVELADGDDMVCRAARGSARPSIGLRFARRRSLSGLCVEENRVLRCDDAECDNRVDRAACRRVGARSILVAPLRHRQVVIGVLSVSSTAPYGFGRKDVHALELLAGLVGAAMAHALAFEASQDLLAVEAEINARLASDVTERTARLEAANTQLTALTRSLRESEQRFRAAFDHAPVGIAYTTLDGGWLRINDRLCEIYSRSREELLRLRFQDITYPDDLAADLEQLERLLAHEMESYSMEKRYLRGDGSIVWTTLRVSMVRDNAGVPAFLVAIIEDISDRRMLEERLRHQALHDALTGLSNRTLLQDRFEQALSAARRRGGTVGLLLIDLDRFKEINDTFGHHLGDQLLSELGFRLAESLRASDTIARLGGDEFAILLPTADVNDAARVASKVLQTLEEPITVGQQSFLVEGSIGIAVYPDHGNNANDLLRRADVAMYNAKRSRAGYAFYLADDDHHSIERLALMADMRYAIERDQLLLNFQPKVNLTSGRVEGVEALLRWEHPERGLIPPDIFIALAEHTGLIKPLTEWVLTHALSQCRVWQDRGLALHVAVNLSTRNLHDPQLVPTVERLLQEAGVSATRLQIELTESAVMEDPFRSTDSLGRLRQLGARISIDDFGTGYSSLAYLKQLPLHEVKIDRSFVLDMATSDSDSRIVRATISLGHDLGLQVVAEGVENQAVWDELASYGCDMVQGYYVSKPMAADACTLWLEDWELRRRTGDEAASA
ncbi:MAG TPA: EAL domain-containing protein [Chloroflexota bacterium]